jgi:hypothetical protein
MISWFVHTNTKLYHEAYFGDDGEEMQKHIDKAWSFYNDAPNGAWIYIYDSRNGVHKETKNTSVE